MPFYALRPIPLHARRFQRRNALNANGSVTLTGPSTRSRSNFDEIFLPASSSDVGVKVSGINNSRWRLIARYRTSLLARLEALRKGAGRDWTA